MKTNELPRKTPPTDHHHHLFHQHQRDGRGETGWNQPSWVKTYSHWRDLGHIICVFEFLSLDTHVKIKLDSSIHQQHVESPIAEPDLLNHACSTRDWSSWQQFSLNKTLLTSERTLHVRIDCGSVPDMTDLVESEYAVRRLKEKDDIKQGIEQRRLILGRVARWDVRSVFGRLWGPHIFSQLADRWQEFDGGDAIVGACWVPCTASLLRSQLQSSDSYTTASHFRLRTAESHHHCHSTLYPRLGLRYQEFTTRIEILLEP